MFESGDERGEKQEQTARKRGEHSRYEKERMNAKLF